MSGRFANGAALITGGASGLGEAIALRLGAEGARVLVADADEIGARRVADAIRAAGGDATPLAFDVTREADARRAVAETSCGSTTFLSTPASNAPLHLLRVTSTSDATRRVGGLKFFQVSVMT